MSNQTDQHSTDEQPEAHVEIGFEDVLAALEKGVFEEEHGAIRWSSNYTFLTSVRHEGLTLMAIYKPQRGERPLWDFPDGTLCYRERATFLTSETLGWRIVPPTALRDGPRGLGTVQFYVDHDPDQNYFSFDEDLLPQLMRLAVFDHIVNNADRKGGHCLLDRDGRLWAIDHGITFHRVNKLRTVVWNFAGEPIPEPLLDDLGKLCARLSDINDPFTAEMNTLLHPSEMKAFVNRIQQLLKARHYPQPGPGPNYPWPPV